MGFKVGTGDDISRVHVSGHLDLPDISSWIIYINSYRVTVGGPSTLSFFTFNSSNLNSTDIRNIFDSNTYPGITTRLGDRRICSSAGGGADPRSCNANSDHSLSLLLGGSVSTGTCCTTPGYTGSGCSQRTFPSSYAINLTVVFKAYCPGTPGM